MNGNNINVNKGGNKNEVIAFTNYQSGKKILELFCQDIMATNTLVKIYKTLGKLKSTRIKMRHISITKTYYQIANWVKMTDNLIRLKKEKPQ